MTPQEVKLWMKLRQLTVSAAAEILADGGNAFDAALAGICMAFVAEAVFCSPGGGGFLMARRAGSDQVKLFDFFVETPLKRRPANEVSFFPIYADFGPAKQEFHIGLGSAATPGMAQGLFAMHGALGRLPMKRLVEPAVRAARQGFPLTTFQAYLFTVIAPILQESDGAAAIFAPGGKLMTAGETFRNEGLAETLEWLAEDGVRLFVDGDIGQAIVHQSRDLGGHLTADDLKSYRVELRDPLEWRHAGATVALNPAACGERRAHRLRSRLSRSSCRERRAHRRRRASRRHDRDQRGARQARRRTGRAARRWRARDRVARGLAQSESLSRHHPYQRHRRRRQRRRRESLQRRGRWLHRRQPRLHAEQHAGRGGSYEAAVSMRGAKACACHR
ncbi:MAG: gamma-glutamyltransferase [Hyphomicrobiales bacterium]